MVKYRTYSEEEKTDKTWVDSSNIYFIKMVEDANENKGDLFVTFKNGTTYKYKDVEFIDYIAFIHGGVDASHGKALNKIIKPKYEFEKVDGPTIQVLEEELDKLVHAEEEDNDEEYVSPAREYLEDMKTFFSGLTAMIDNCAHNEDDENITLSNIIDELRNKIEEYEN